MLSNYPLKVADFYNIPISTVKKFVPNFSDHLQHNFDENLQLYLRLGLTIKTDIVY